MPDNSLPTNDDFEPREPSTHTVLPTLWDKYDKTTHRTKPIKTAKVLTTDTFVADYKALTDYRIAEDPYMNSVPKAFETWNIDGLEPRMKNDKTLLQDYKTQVNGRKPSLIFIQEVRLRCHPDQGHGIVHPDDQKWLTQLCELLPDYSIVALSLARKKYAGQLLLLRTGIQMPHIMYSFGVSHDSHDLEGRIIIAEFKDIKVLSTYVPCTGRLAQESLIKRRQFDRAVLKFVTSNHAVASKPLIYCGDLNATLHDSDMNQPPSYWSGEAITSQPTHFEKAEPDHFSFPGTSIAERRGLQETILRGGLMDPGDNPHKQGAAHFTWRGHPRSIYKNSALRLDYILVPLSLNNQQCIHAYQVCGQPYQRRGFFGSDHAPVFLELRPDWYKRLKLASCKIILPTQKTPLPVVKARERQRSSKQHSGAYKQSADRVGMLQTLILATYLFSVLSPMEPPKATSKSDFQVHKTGQILLDGGKSLDAQVLFDTGCQSANYMSQEFLDNNLSYLEPLLAPATATVYFGDRTASAAIRHLADLEVKFIHNGTTKSAKCRFLVLPGKGCDLIIGTPDIFTSYGDIFLDMVKAAVTRPEKENTERESLKSPEERDTINMSPVNSDLNVSYKELDPPVGAEYPWKTEIDLEAPEDDLIPEASSFGPSVLNFLEQSLEDEKNKYKKFIETNVDPEFLRATNVRELLLRYEDNFVKSEWKGLNIEPLEFEFEDLPDRLKPYMRTIPVKLLPDTKKEYERLLTYFYQLCDSPHASPLVVAPKATAPFIRLCANLQRVNQYIRYGHQYIPHVQHTIQELRGYKYFLDIDARNGYHQIPLAELTSKRLSVQTPWGQVRPLFMPEGVCCGTAVFQKTMMEIFDPLNDGSEQRWCFVLHDNFLIGADSHKDAYEKLEKLLERARQYNVYLKMEKTHLGHAKQHFFGYDIEEGGYSMSADRSEKLEKVPFPSGKSAACATAMRSFLGQTRIFQPHVADYTSFSSPLDEMTSKDFDWEKATWKKNYEDIFEKFKNRLKDAMKLFYPDHELDWILRTDASEYGYGGILYQTYIDASGVKIYQPLKFMSKKFSDPATRWDTFTQECYAIFACIKDCEYLLRGKSFVIETDHNNLLWLEQSAVPKIIRQHLYIRSFITWIRHVPGKINSADYWSRLIQDVSALPVAGSMLSALCASCDEDQFSQRRNLDNVMLALEKFKNKHGTPLLNRPDGSTKSADEIIATVHGGTFLHNGSRRTWLLLNEIYPGHRIPLRTVTEFIENCAVCQKHKQGLRDTIEPLVRVLKPDTHRHTIGVDTVTITPTSEDGYVGIITMVNHHTHFVYLYPVKTHSAKEMCHALMSYVKNFGLFDELKSDPGSDLMSQAVADLNTWLGLRHQVSLTDVHTSNGCENTNKQVVQHLSTLCADLRLKECWSDPLMIGLVQFHFNSSLSREAGVAPFVATFGSADATYLDLNPNVPMKDIQSDFVKKLDRNLKAIRAVSAEHQAKLAADRTAENHTKNQFAVDDLVLHAVRTPTKPWREEKLGVDFTGPWRVIHVHANDYTVEHLVTGESNRFPVDSLKPYFGTIDDGYQAGQLDADQHVVTSVSHYHGDPTARRTCEFFIHYADGDSQWNIWRPDLTRCAPFQTFCKAHPELWQFLHTKTDANRLAIQLNKQPITKLTLGQMLYVDLRAIGAVWYNYESELPHQDYKTYVMPCTVTAWRTKSKNRVRVVCTLLEVFLDWTHAQAVMWGQFTTLQPEHVLVSSAFLSEHPKLVPSLVQWSAAYHKLLHYQANKPNPPPLKSDRPRVNTPKTVQPTKKTVKFVEAASRTTRSSTRLQGGKG